ncbi:MAG: hypothetical protein P4M13_03560 [Alphaproteobacteria bacterium]|nr:hypothetical protein [Alphaproteobacteria bacterium]
MRVSLIGMANIGKTHLSRLMADALGYAPVDCDALIEQRLASELAKGGFRGIGGVAEWMGLPFAPQYKQNSALYIACEQAVMREIIDGLRRDQNSSAVIDTTGSVIYMEPDILEGVRAATRVVYLEASEEHTAELFKNYIATPKPVFWGESFAPLAGETPQETLRRCYPELLRYRARRYREIAHVTIPYEQHQNRKADVCDLILKQIAPL